MPLQPTPYDAKLKRIRSRIKQDKGGKNLKSKLRNLKVKQYGHQQANRPPSPLPWNAQAETTVGGINRDLNFGNLALQHQEQGIRQQYGFDDQSNPFALASQLQRNYQQNRRNTLNTYASQGHLYSGALSNARNIDRYDFERGYDELRRSYASDLQGIADQRLKLQREAQEGIIGADAERLESALSEPPDPSESPPTPHFVKKHRGQLKKKLARAKDNNNRKRIRKLKKRIRGLDFG